MHVRQKVTETWQVKHGEVQGKHVGTPGVDVVNIVLEGHREVSTQPTFVEE